MSDQDGISPKKYNYNIKHTSDENGNINWGIISWSNHKFSALKSYELFDSLLGELLMRSWEWKGW